MHRKVADLYEYLYIYCGEARGNVLYGTVTPETLTEFQMTEEEAFVLSHKNNDKNNTFVNSRRERCMDTEIDGNI